ncbi:unnamed protein product, partial [Acanthoscelides obtectus]
SSATSVWRSPQASQSNPSQFSTRNGRRVKEKGDGNQQCHVVDTSDYIHTLYYGKSGSGESHTRAATDPFAVTAALEMLYQGKINSV